MNSMRRQYLSDHFIVHLFVLIAELRKGKSNEGRPWSHDHSTDRFVKSTRYDTVAFNRDYDYVLGFLMIYSAAYMPVPYQESAEREIHCPLHIRRAEA